MACFGSQDFRYTVLFCFVFRSASAMRLRGYLTVVLVAMGCFANSTTRRTCGPGQLLDPVQDKCLDCPDNEYNKDENHTNAQCSKCTSADPRNYEKVLVECNKTHNSVIGCIEGRFRNRNDCDICTNCSSNINGRIYTSRACTQGKDATCTDKSVIDPDSIITTSPGNFITPHCFCIPYVTYTHLCYVIVAYMLFLCYFL